MESVLKKFEKNAVDMSSIYGGSDIFTGERSYANSGGAYYTGREFLRIDEDGCGYVYLSTSSGIFFVDYVC